jgi:hypothetical protein
MMQSVQVIIERLKSHPEDFFGDMEGRLIGRHAPKFNDVREKLDNLLTEPQDGHTHRLWYLNEDEKLALLEAYKEARRARFEAKVFHTLLTKPDEAELNVATRQHPVTGKQLMQGWQGLMQGSQEPNKMIVPQNMINAATKILRDEMDKQHAENRNPRP